MLLDGGDLEAERGARCGDLARVVGLDTADGDKRVTALRKGVWEKVSMGVLGRQK